MSAVNFAGGSLSRSISWSKSAIGAASSASSPRSSIQLGNSGPQANAGFAAIQMAALKVQSSNFKVQCRRLRQRLGLRQSSGALDFTRLDPGVPQTSGRMKSARRLAQSKTLARPWTFDFGLWALDFGLSSFLNLKLHLDIFLESQPANRPLLTGGQAAR